MKKAILFFFVLVCGRNLYGQAGMLDNSFDLDGKQIYDNNFGIDLAKGVAIQPDGKILVAGYTKALGSFYNDFLVVRYLSNGALDMTFGTGGKVVTAVSPYNDEAYGIALQTDGKILVAGRSEPPLASGSAFVVVRYLSNGTLDNTFNGSGIVETQIATNSAAYAVALQPDGKIVLVGEAALTSYNFAIARYLNNGSIDNSFGIGGTTLFGFSPFHAVAVSLGIQADGKIVCAGGYNDGNTDRMAVARLTTGGVLDTTFNSTGKKTFVLANGGEVVTGVAIQNDGRILLGGHVHNGNSGNDFTVLRLLPNSNLDTSWNSTGIAHTNLNTSGDYGKAIFITPDQKVLMAGITENVNGKDFGLVRYTSAGKLDTSFNTTGIVITPFSVNLDNSAFAVAMQTDGKIVVAGDAFNGSNLDFAVARYLGGGLATEVENDLSNRYSVELFPNPSNERFTIRLSGNDEKSLQVKIYDILGKEMVQITKPIENSECQIEIPSWLSNGLYWVQIQTKAYTQGVFWSKQSH